MFVDGSSFQPLDSSGSTFCTAINNFHIFLVLTIYQINDRNIEHRVTMTFNYLDHTFLPPVIS